MRAPIARTVFWTWIVCMVGCANILGFNDFTLGDAGLDGGDATTAEGSLDAVVEGPHDATREVDSFVAREGGDAIVADAGPDADAAADAEADADADADADAGCGPTTTTDNCGACGRSCGDANATRAECSDAGTCLYDCKPGWANCDASPPNTFGCETPTDTPTNCTGCGLACDTDSSFGASCKGGTCTYQSCVTGQVDCDAAAPDLNGCETHVASSANCGACGSSCDTTSGHSNGATCDGGTCFYASCAPGWADCNPTPPDTHGCNTPLSSVSNCAKCGQACDTATGTPACDGGTCSYACSTGRADCNAATAPNLDGCECPTPGCCGSSCQTPHSNGIGGSYYDCTGILSNNHDQTHAHEACVSFTQNSSQCTDSSSGLCLSLNLSAQSVCSSGGTACYCWQYSGPNAGHVQSGSCSATCGSGSDPTWN